MAVKWDNASEFTDRESIHETPPNWIIRRKSQSRATDQNGWLLAGLKRPDRLEWNGFHPELERVHDKDRKNQAGTKPFDVLVMFKILVLPYLHN